MIGDDSTDDHWPSVDAPPAVTVTVALPLTASLVAVIVAVPAARPVTSPVDETEATPDASADQVTTRPARGFPVASFGVAVSCTIPPEAIFDVAGVTTTDATLPELDETVTRAVPLTPSLVAVIVADPIATPATRPVGDTVAN